MEWFEIDDIWNEAAEGWGWGSVEDDGLKMRLVDIVGLIALGVVSVPQLHR